MLVKVDIQPVTAQSCENLTNPNFSFAVLEMVALLRRRSWG